jgi:hypothetical protein
VRAYPQVLGHFDGRSFFQDLLGELDGPDGARRMQDRIERTHSSPIRFSENGAGRDRQSAGSFTRSIVSTEPAPKATGMVT